MVFGQQSTLEEMQLVAEQRGGKCLSTEYVNAHTQLCWQCIVGHTWEAEPRDIKFRARWCPACGVRTRRQFTLEDLKTFARRLGGECLSAKYANANIKLQWRCGKGHVWKSTPAEVKHYKGNWCPACNAEQIGQKFSNKRIDKTAKQRASKHLLTKHVNSHTKQRHRGSPFTLEKMRELARQRGGECLSDEYMNTRTKLKWRCGAGHIWEATPFCVKNSTVWCPFCAKRIKSKPLSKMKELAKERGGECLSDDYADIKTKLKWRCKAGHIWEATPISVRYNKKWCFTCTPWINRLDKRTNVNTQPLTIKEMKALAKQRGGKCLSDAYKNNYTKLRWQCGEGHVWESVPRSVKYEKAWCPTCAEKIQSKPSLYKMKELAKQRGGECLSGEYINAKTKLRWQCGDGHVWKAKPFSVKNRKIWCPTCASHLRLQLDKIKNSTKKRGERRRRSLITVEQMKEIARQRGGECLSGEYINAITNLQWQCGEGHFWEARPDRIKYAKTWCPVCANKMRGIRKFKIDTRPLTIEEMQKLARQRDGECLSTEYVNSYTKLRWRCQKGHVWESVPKSVKYAKAWCPVCLGRQEQNPADQSFRASA